MRACFLIRFAILAVIMGLGSARAETAPSTQDARASKAYEAIVAAAEHELRDRYASRVETMEIDAVPARSGLPCNVEGVGSVSIVGNDVLPAKRMEVLVTVACTTGARRTIPVWFNLSATARLWVAAYDISSATRLTVDSVREEVREVGGRPPFLKPESNDWADFRATRMIPAGSVLNRAEVEKAPVIAIGDTVLAAARRGDVMIQTTTVAAEEGNIGQVIRVTRTDSGAILKVRVQHAGSGEVLSQ